jgi:hypothetical protein
MPSSCVNSIWVVVLATGDVNLTWGFSWVDLTTISPTTPISYYNLECKQPNAHTRLHQVEKFNISDFEHKLIAIHAEFNEVR